MLIFRWKKATSLEDKRTRNMYDVYFRNRFILRSQLFSSWSVAVSPRYSQYLPDIPPTRVYNGHVAARQSPVCVYKPAEVLGATPGAEIEALGCDQGLAP